MSTIRNFTLCFIALSLGLISSSCSDSTLKSTQNTGWNNAISTDDVYARQISANDDNLLLMGFGKNGQKLIVINKANQIVEQRTVESTRAILTPDFYATVGNYGDGLGKDSTVVKFYSTKAAIIDPIGIFDSRTFRSASAPSNYRGSQIQITFTPMSDGSYGVLLAYGSSVATNIDVAKIRIQSNKVAIVNKKSIGTFSADQIPYVGDDDYPFAGGNNLIFSFKDKFVVKFPNKLYSYASDASISSVTNLPVKYWLNDVSFTRNDTLFIRQWDYTLQYTTDLNGNWKSIVNSERVRTFSDNYFVNESISPFNIYKFDRSKNQIQLVSSDELVGVVNPISNSKFIVFKNEVYLVNGNLVYVKPLKNLLPN